MYGFVNSALEKLIKRRFGVGKWEEIRKHAKLFLGDQDSFHVNHVYNDDDTYSMVYAASDILGLDAATILEMFGEQFLLSCQESGYAKTLQLLGRTLQDFLTNLDALHDHLSIIYPQMDAPSFRCTAGLKKTEFLLHYYSDRPSLEQIVMGIVKSVAREYYHVELDMKVAVKKGENSDHTIFSIREVAYHRTSIIDKDDLDHTIKSFADKQLISSETFCKAFPFHIVFDSSLTILQVGSSLSWVMPSLQLKKDNLANYFHLERPRIKLSFTNILSHINTIFILRMTPLVNPASSSRSVGKNDRLSISMACGSDPMRLRGQMVHAPESEAMLFICSPRVKQLHDLEQRGLYLSDIPIHDATRGMLMMGQAAAAEFTKSVRLEELIIDLSVTQKSLEEEKKRMSDLLHQMLPISVADSLMAGQMVDPERFESVTILFSDIVGFTSICSQSEPMQIVSMLNRLYSMFDQVVGQNQVYKVETIGDAYMVVGGLPKKNTIHAECVANQALDMMHYCKQVTRPDNNEPITMRIGIHSGAVVAGIVGRRMPRYCLFGNTVNVASRTESNGTPGKIQITDYTYSLLKDKPNFKFEFRGSIEFKNVPAPVKCYYLVANLNKEEYQPITLPDESEPVAFQFMLTTTPSSPPITPQLTEQLNLNPSPGNIAEMLSRSSNGKPTCPIFNTDSAISFQIPDLNVTRPTPNCTPNPSPPNSQKTSITDQLNTFIAQSLFCPAQHIISPVHPHDSSRSSDNTGNIPNVKVDETEKGMASTFPPFSVSILEPSDEEQQRQTDMDNHHFHSHNSLSSMRHTSMSPLQEDLNEEESLSLFNLDEGIDLQRKISDVSNCSTESGGGGGGGVSKDKKHTSRKVSDTSNHSGESGIESASDKLSPSSSSSTSTAKEGVSLDTTLRKMSQDRKVSTSSGTENELATIRRKRAGSVSKVIDQFNRQRKSGLPMVVNPKPGDLANNEQTAAVSISRQAGLPRGLVNNASWS